jgi:hypothetical protein
MSDFFSFHRLLSTSIIKATYLCGMLVINLLGVVEVGAGIYGLLQSGQTSPAMQLIMFREPLLAITGGLIVLIAGNLFWRLLCEAWILVFSMHEMVSSIERSMRVGDGLPSVGYQRTIT